MATMEHRAGVETEWGEETLRVLFVGLTVWIVGSVATFAALSGSELPAELANAGMRAATLLVGFGLGAVALLGYGTLRLHSGARVGAVVRPAWQSRAPSGKGPRTRPALACSARATPQHSQRQHHDGRQEQQVDEPAEGLPEHDADQPQHHEYDEDRPEHERSLLGSGPQLGERKNRPGGCGRGGW
jgi:hypothetical protein